LLNRGVRAKRVLDAGLALECASALALLAVGLAGLGSALIVAALVMVFISAFGLVFPNAVHEAVHPLPEIAGLASAVVTTVQSNSALLAASLPPRAIATLRPRSWAPS
jgi:DHA1 family bicyclomycin/chloramphenicol resistance-like MFS transporter